MNETDIVVMPCTSEQKIEYLRDVFAGQAMGALITNNPNNFLNRAQGKMDDELLSKVSYEIADAMLAKRNKIL